MIDKSQLTFKLRREPTPDMLALLNKLIYGSKKGVQYSLKNTKDRIYNLKEPLFFTLELNNKILSLVVMTAHGKLKPKDGINYYYVRYFAVDPSIQEQGVGTYLMHKVGHWFVYENTDPAIFIGYIEEKNVRSFKISQNMKSEVISTFNSHIYSRLSVPNIKLRKIEELEYLTKIQPLLTEQFNQHLFYCDELSFKKLNYLVYEKEGEILVGAQIYEVNWEVHHLPGKQGDLLKSLSKFPYLKRIFNPHEFNFNSFDQFYISPKATKKDVNTFFQGVINHTKNHVNLTFLDEKDPKQEIISKLKGGILEKLQKKWTSS